MGAKIQNNLQELLQAEVITPDVASAINAFYKKKAKSTPNRLFSIFGVLGSLLIGLGIILILAHNWDNFSRATKTIWAFVPLVIGQFFAGIALFKKLGAAWRETAATFLFFAVGTSISLVSQIYNIPGSMSSFILTWIVLTAPIIYLLRSHTAAILHLVYATFYTCNVGYFESFLSASNSIPWYYLVMITFVIPFYLKQIAKDDSNSTVIYHWLIPLSVLITSGAFVAGNRNIGFLIYLGLFGLYYNLGKLPFFEQKQLRINGYRILGSLGTIFTLLLASFKDVWDFNYQALSVPADMLIATLVILAAVAVFALTLKRSDSRSINPFQIAFLIFGGFYFVASYTPALVLIGINLLVLALGLYAIYLGTRQNRFSILNYGLIIITLLVSCRFFDTDLSFVLRGLLFVCIGVGFFATNYIMYRKQQKLKSYE